MKRVVVIGFCAVVVMGFAGCADPTEGKPEAVVSEASGDAAAAMDESAAPEGALTFTDASKISFIGSKVTGSHDGGFNEFDGSVAMEGDDVTTATIDVTIDMNSTWTDTDRLTGHLKSPDFFDVENHPKSRFTSTKIEADGDAYSVTGDLTLHGVTKSVTFPASISYDDGTLTANAEFSINRMDFGIVYPGKPDDLIREDVLIKLDIVAS